MAKIPHYAPWIVCEDTDGSLASYLNNEGSVADFIEEIMKELRTEYDKYESRELKNILICFGSKEICASVDSVNMSASFKNAITASLTVTIRDKNTGAFGITHITAIRIDE